MGNQTSGYFIKFKSAVEGHEYDYNPNYNQEKIHSDYTGFYIGISAVAFLGIAIIVCNLCFGCCSPWKKYWNNRNSGNR